MAVSPTVAAGSRLKSAEIAAGSTHSSTILFSSYGSSEFFYHTGSRSATKWKALSPKEQSNAKYNMSSHPKPMQVKLTAEFDGMLNKIVDIPFRRVSNSPETYCPLARCTGREGGFAIVLAVFRFSHSVDGGKRE
jgi:hypothetical protein